MLEDDGITAAIEELQSRLGDLQNSIDQALQVYPFDRPFDIYVLDFHYVFCREEREEDCSCNFSFCQEQYKFSERNAIESNFAFLSRRDSNFEALLNSLPIIPSLMCYLSGKLRRAILK